MIAFQLINFSVLKSIKTKRWSLSSYDTLARLLSRLYPTCAVNVVFRCRMCFTYFTSREGELFDLGLYCLCMHDVLEEYHGFTTTTIGLKFSAAKTIPTLISDSMSSRKRSRKELKNNPSPKIMVWLEEAEGISRIEKLVISNSSSYARIELLRVLQGIR